MTEPHQVLNFVGGQYRESSQSFELRNPADDTLAAIVFEASEADVADAVAAARDALNGPWARMSMDERHAMMRRVADLILERKDEFVAAEIADSGHPYTPVATMEIPRGAEQFRIFADIAAAGYEPEIVDTPMPDGRTAVNHTQRVPKGVIAAICPFVW